MSNNRDRKEASKRLGLELRKRYQALVTSGNDPNAVSTAAIHLGALFNENIEFIVWVMLTFGGMDNIPAPERRPPPPAQDLPRTPLLLLNDPANGLDG